MDDNKNLNAIIKQIHDRGNDVEIRVCKDGKKIYEVTRKLLCTIEENKKE